MMYTSIFAALIAASSAQNLTSTTEDMTSTTDNPIDVLLDDLPIDISEIGIADFSDDLWSILSTMDPESLVCNSTDQVICDEIDFMECNEEWGFCGVPCDSAEDCKNIRNVDGMNVTGTGLSVCNVDGFCEPNINGTCSEDDDCPSLVGWTCDIGNNTCRHPLYCDDNDDCADMEDGLKSCNEGICGVEFCFDNGDSDCVSDGYVCQSELICVPDCNDYGCDDVGLTCGGDGLCYMAELCTVDSDCDAPFNTCIENVTGTFDADDLPISSSVCATTCDTNADCEGLDIPWASCLMNTTCIMQPDLSIFTNLTRWLDTCNVDAECEYPTPLCIDTGLEEVGGICVVNDTDLITNITGLTACMEDEDCPYDLPVCFNETIEFTDTGYCVPACDTDQHCIDMGLENGVCQDTGLPYDTCVTMNSCDIHGDSTDCGDDQICIIDTCMGSCDTDQDCSGSTKCVDFVEEIPFFDVEVDFSYCDVFEEDSENTTTTMGVEADFVPAPTDGGSRVAVFSAFVVVFTAVMY